MTPDWAWRDEYLKGLKFGLANMDDASPAVCTTLDSFCDLKQSLEKEVRFNPRGRRDLEDMLIQHPLWATPDEWSE